VLAKFHFAEGTLADGVSSAENKEYLSRMTRQSAWTSLI